MPTISKFANAHTAITGGYTSPTNAYADDGVAATAAPAQNAEISAYFGFPAFTTGDIPDGSMIKSVQVDVEFSVSTTGSIATQYAQVFRTTTAVGSDQSNSAEPAAYTVLSHNVTSGVSLTDLRTADLVRCRARSVRGSSATAVTFNIDFVRVTVEYVAYPMDFPGLLPARVTARRARAQAMSQSPLSYAQQVYDHGGRAWVINVEMQPMDETDAATFGLFLHDLDGRAGTFNFDLDPWTPGAAPAVGTKTFRLVNTDPPWESSFGNVFMFRFTAQEVV